MVSTDWFYTACRYTDGYIENAIRKPKAYIISITSGDVIYAASLQVLKIKQ